jgi:microcystin-dependent protein
MANLPESSTWETGIYQIETTDAVIGGVNGISNIQGKQLGNRTKYLYDQLGLTNTALTTLDGTVNNHETRIQYLENSGVGSHGANNFIKGVNTLTPSGGSVSIPAVDVGELNVINVNASAVVVTLPSYSVLTIGDKIFVVLIATNPIYDEAQVFFSPASGQTITGDVNHYIPGDHIEFTFRGTINGWVVSSRSKKMDGIVGEIRAFSTSTPPPGWLEANGAAISRTTYAKLFAKIGVTWGAGNGTTTFNIPDTRGYFLRGWDNGAGVDTGRVFASTQADLLKNHTHNYNTKGGTMPQSGNDTQCWVQDSTAVTGGVNDGLGGSETRPKNIAVMFCIKY